MKHQAYHSSCEVGKRGSHEGGGIFGLGSAILNLTIIVICCRRRRRHRHHHRGRIEAEIMLASTSDMGVYMGMGN